MGNLITVAAGFFLGSQGFFPLGLFITTIIGLSLIIASACVLNNVIDWQIDKKMERTKDRPLAKGLVSAQNAIVFGIILAIGGFSTLFIFSNLLTTGVAFVGFFVYVVFYSFLKSRTVYATAIGSIAGAVPPVVGYCAVTNDFDPGAMILFMIMVLWQMPHFFSIAILHLEDYTRVNLPVLPVEKGIWRTKVHMALYILAFIPTAALLTFFDYTGYMYLFVILSIGLAWLGACVQGFTTDNHELWGLQMFRLSLLMITALCVAIPFDLST